MRATHQSSLLSPLLLLSSVSLVTAGLTRRALSVPDELPDGWEYKGCYTDVGRTISAADYTDNEEMTIESCIAFCTDKGFQYAGTEWFQECYCGSSLAAGAAEAPEADCNSACTGDSTQPCGGGDRLSLFQNSALVGPSANPGVNGFTHIGCYSEGTTGRALTNGAGLPAAEMTVADCTAACHSAGFILAGVEYGGECYCGNKISNGGAPATSGCSMVCNGNHSEFCGGPNRLNVYDYEMQFPTGTNAAETTSTAAGTGSVVAEPTGPAQPPTVGGYTWYGCVTEATNMRALSAATFAADTMTLESCQTFCADYEYFGVEYARECYCGNKFNAGSVSAPESDCNFPCAGDGSEYCGAGNRLSVYSKNGESPPTGTATEPSSSATSNPSNPQPTGLPDGWSAQGCWIDGVDGRILSYQDPDSQTLTPQSCAAVCESKGYTISGTEWAQQCFCGKTIINGGEKTDDSDCNTPCTGDSTQMCGAGGRMSIISKGTPVVDQPPAPQTGGLEGSWTYQGCVTDNINDQRTFFWQLYFPGEMTANMCLSRCSDYGYMAAGLEYGEECYCGDPANIETHGATFQPESECNIACAGNASAICGGGSRLSTYFWTGEPLYSWDFPQDYRAGQYENLINGVTVPLMTQETIEGRVSFLSKWGTGRANETGAYELDLTKINNPQQAWRELHVKTDIFCSAGITLPDKAGRHLNVGGWSGDSTEGVRLYWPDGNHDWEENVNELSLQVGRWYPSAMVMSNGSIMVIGGEIGSNSAAVPSIEVLPYTGTAPLYMEWLDRTDPNNLYPFVCVLPQSGGIFVAYWNEARILSPVTFETIKTLPNAPGAVNDDLGGRTYPLEGTAVLLPQKAPYDEDLGILICGGSTNGPGNAIDNCVTIFPESDEPTWTIERLPSFRVMPCMAPLPDGTYLIANGAHHGVAGFGLANNPNLNALLYDPSKPIGSRITVAANTTIARLYHSEAITLLDGRVLISGSDPEDGVNPQEYRVEVFVPPYLLNGKPRPTFTIANTDWAYGQAVTVNVGAVGNGAITASLLGAVSSTHGNSMGARTLIPAISCSGGSCTITAPPNAKVAPPGWYQLFILDGGVPAVGVYVRIGGDPAELGNWPPSNTFSKPGV